MYNADYNFGEKTIIQSVKFTSLIPTPVGEALDMYFQENKWDLQLWQTREAVSGYQVFFGKGVQVDNNFEYGFPHLFEEDELIRFANSFYDTHITISHNSRTQQLINEIFDYLTVHLGSHELYGILHDDLGMSHEDISLLGFDLPECNKLNKSQEKISLSEQIQSATNRAAEVHPAGQVPEKVISPEH